MLQETMKTVEEAEAKAAGILAQAKEDADATLAQARKEAADIAGETDTASKTALKSAGEEMDAQEKVMIDEALAQAEADIEKLKGLAAERQSQAIDQILKELV